MGMSRCYTAMKCLLTLLNIVFLCVGCGVCALCGWALWAGGAGEGAEARAGLAVLAAWAAALCVAAITALAGACRNSSSLLACAFALLSLTAVAEGAAAWWGAAHVPALRGALLARLSGAVQREYGDSAATTQILDAIQEGLECCGSAGARDWATSRWSLSREAGAAGEVAGAGEEGAALDLRVSAAGAYYWVPASCGAGEVGAEVGAVGAVGERRVAVGEGGAGEGCGPLVLRRLGEWARGPLLSAAALLAAHLLALLLALALCLRVDTQPRYKA